MLVGAGLRALPLANYQDVQRRVWQGQMVGAAPMTRGYHPHKLSQNSQAFSLTHVHLLVIKVYPGIGQLLRV